MLAFEYIYRVQRDSSYYFIDVAFVDQCGGGFCGQSYALHHRGNSTQANIEKSGTKIINHLSISNF